MDQTPNPSLAHQSIITVDSQLHKEAHQFLSRWPLEATTPSSRPTATDLQHFHELVHPFWKAANSIASATSQGSKFQNWIKGCVKKKIPFVCPDSSRIQFHWATSGSSGFYDYMYVRMQWDFFFTLLNKFHSVWLNWISQLVCNPLALGLLLNCCKLFGFPITKSRTLLGSTLSRTIKKKKSFLSILLVSAASYFPDQ